MNLCRACGSDFASVTAFDKHRVGVHAYLWSPELEDGRRCLEVDELPDVGMELDPRGRWRMALTEERQQVLNTLREQNSPRIRASGPQVGLPPTPGSETEEAA